MASRGHKHCVGCRETKPHGEFYEDSTGKSPDGFNRYCKLCCKVNRALEGVRKRDKKSKLSIRQKHRAMALRIEFEEVKLVKVFKRYQGHCAICREWVQPRLASMDHILPLSRGGVHTYGNIQLTHLLCNLRKGAKCD